MKILKFMLFVGIIFSCSSYAITLKEATSKGLVVEKLTGYIEAKSSDAEVEKLVETVNAGRKKEYGKMAKKHNTTVEEIAKRYGERKAQSKKKK